jgi:arsenate reductase
MRLHLYGLKACSTCREARKTLEAAGHDVVFTDVRAEGFPAGAVTRFLAEYGPDLVNRRSLTWRGMTEEERAADPETQLTAYPALMKRPLFDVAGALHLGWGEDVQAALLG